MAKQEEIISKEDSIAVSKPDTLSVNLVTEEPDDEESFYKILELEKTSCYGKCPAFKVEIFSNGQAIYHGEANVERTGTFVTQVNNSFIYIILQEAENIGFFDSPGNYPVKGADIPDLPKTIIYLNSGKKDHRIVDSFDTPANLLKFENFLSEKIESLYWEKQK